MKYVVYQGSAWTVIDELEGVSLLEDNGDYILAKTCDLKPAKVHTTKPEKPEKVAEDALSHLRQSLIGRRD